MSSLFFHFLIKSLFTLLKSTISLHQGMGWWHDKWLRFNMWLGVWLDVPTGVGNRSMRSVWQSILCQNKSSINPFYMGEFREFWQKLLADWREVEFMFCIMTLDQAVGNFMCQGEVPDQFWWADQGRAKEGGSVTMRCKLQWDPHFVLGNHLFKSGWV